MFKARFLVAAGLFAASFVFAMPAPATAAAPEEVRFGWFGGPRPWIIGKAEGTFDKALGTKVKWVQFPSGAAALTSLAAKEVDISRLGSTPTVASMVRKLPIEMIAISGVIATSERLIAKEGIGSVPALKGKRIAYPPGSTAHYALMAALKVHNVPAADVKLISLTPADMVAAWTRGDIDAGYVWGPFSHQMEGRGGKELLVTQQLQPHGYFVWNDYVVRTEFAKQYPDIVVKFLQAFQATMDRYNADKEATVKLVAQHLTQDVNAVRDTMAGLYFPPLKEQLSAKFLGDGGPIYGAMMDSARFLVELGDLKQGDLPADFKPFVNLTYMKKAAGQ